MNKEIIKSGLILGLISIAMTVLVYVVDETLMVKLWYGLIALALSLFLVSYLGIKYRNEHTGGFMSFGQAYGFSIVAMITSGIVSTIFMILLYSVIDPELPQVLGDAAYEQSLAMMKSFGADPDSLDDDMLDKMREDSMARFGVMGSVKGLIGVVIGSAILSLITGLIIKRKEPENEIR